MYERLSAKDIIALNQQFADGRVINASSLDYAIDEANQNKSWLRSCAILVRAVLIDHVFDEGNKRTAAAIIVGYLSENSHNYSPELVAKGVAKILMKNMTNTRTIERVIKDAII